MPTLAEFLKGTVEDSLKKLIAPSGLVPAALFVLLNLAFVYPAARAEKVGIALEFKALDAAWQVVAVSAAVLLVGYLVSSASSGVLDTLSGRTWRLSLTHVLLSWWRDRRRNALARRVSRGHGGGVEPLYDAAWRRLSRFAPQKVGSAPTALGDVLLATDGTARARYGMAPAAIWEPLRAMLKEEDVAGKLVAEEKSTVDLMAGLWLALVAFFVEALVVFTLMDRSGKALAAVLALPFAYAAYRVAVTKTVSWTDGILNAFAMKQNDLAKALSLRTTGGAADRRALWDETSRFFLERFEAKFDEIYGRTTVEPALSVTANVEVDSEATEVTTHVYGGEAADQGIGIAYTLFVVAPAREEDGTISGDIVLTDPRIDRISADLAIEFTNASVVASVIRAPTPEATDGLLLHVSGLAPGDATTVRTTLLRWRLAVTNGLVLTAAELTDGALHGVVTNRTSAAVPAATLTLFHVKDGRQVITVRAPGGRLGPQQRIDESLAWAVSRLGPGETFRFVIRLADEEEAAT